MIDGLGVTGLQAFLVFAFKTPKFGEKPMCSSVGHVWELSIKLASIYRSMLEVMHQSSHFSIKDIGMHIYCEPSNRGLRTRDINAFDTIKVRDTAERIHCLLSIGLMTECFFGSESLDACIEYLLAHDQKALILSYSGLTAEFLFELKSKVPELEQTLSNFKKLASVE